MATNVVFEGLLKKEASVVPSMNSSSPLMTSDVPRRTATLAAYLFLAAALLFWLHAWYSTLAWGPQLYVSQAKWYTINSSLFIALAAAIAATWLATRQRKEGAIALAALVAATLLLLLFRALALPAP